MIVEDHVDGRRYYSFDPQTGEIQVHSTGSANRCGVGCVIRDRRSKRATFAAIYAIEDRLWLSVGSRRFDITTTIVSVRIQRSLLRRRLIIVDKGQPVFEMDYRMRWVYLSTWPAPGDLFEYVEEQTETSEKRFRALARWTAAAVGLDLNLPAVRLQIEDHYQRLLRSLQA